MVPKNSLYLLLFVVANLQDCKLLPAHSRTIFRALYGRIDGLVSGILYPGCQTSGIPLKPGPRKRSFEPRSAFGEFGDRCAPNRQTCPDARFFGCGWFDGEPVLDLTSWAR